MNDKGSMALNINHQEGLLKEGERLDDLHRNGYCIIQSPERFCFGCDAVLLSNFAKVKKGETVLDLGTGTGIIPILLEAKTEGAFFYGLEIQEESVEMARRSVKWNQLEHKIDIIHGDIKEMVPTFKKGTIDVITTNPPYMNHGGGMTNVQSPKAIARHELLCNLEQIISGSALCLKTNGRFYMIHRPQRLPEIMMLLQKYQLEPKTLRMVYPKIHQKPTMILVEAIKNARPMLNVLPPLIMYEEDGTYTAEVHQIYYE